MLHCNIRFGAWIARLNHANRPPQSKALDQTLKKNHAYGVACFDLILVVL